MTLTDNLIAAWKLDGNGNDSHNSYNASTTGTINWDTGKDGQSAKFPSSGTNYLRNTSIPTPGANPFSVSFWYRFVNTTNTNNRCFFQLTAGSGYRRFLSVEWFSSNSFGWYTEFGFRENSSGGYINHQSVEAKQNDTSLDTNWHHIVVVVDTNGGKARIRLYRDATLLDSQTHSTYDYSLPSDSFCGVFLGVYSAWTSSCGSSLSRPTTDAQMDEVYLWHRALTEQEISTLYNGGNGLFYPFQPQGKARRLLI